jgi:hypothetical protein
VLVLVPCCAMCLALCSCSHGWDWHVLPQLVVLKAACKPSLAGCCANISAVRLHYSSIWQWPRMTPAVLELVRRQVGSVMAVLF